MAYKALYRTYRPQLFREVVGQEAIVKTLQNAIANNKISHAYLFSGPRGTGKTTIARIFAKALNCNDLTMLEPCDRCKSCYEISDSNSPDVIEIDAASNNGVDEIRDIREKVKFLPSGAKYKIYIIDEVHMLSTGAFNALLKTLEEPPQHVVFILATTEPQKLPPTIISRCQRFDFKALTVNEISKRIRLVCADEEVEISEEAVNAISEAAEGALRDALSILDQAISYSDDIVDIEDVNAVTGNLSYNKLIELASHFHSGNVNNALEAIQELIDLGKEVNRIVSGLLQFYRDMLLYQNIDTDSIMYYKYIFGKDSFIELAKATSPEKIFYYLDVLSDVQMKIKYSSTPRIYLEVAIIKMINVSNEDLDLLSRIERLENQTININAAEIEFDNEKLNLLEMKVNKIVDELHKLEIHKLAERIDNISSGNFERLENQIVSLNEEMVTLKETFSQNELIQRIKYLQEDIDKVKLAITELKNREYDSKDFGDYKKLKDKLINLEKNMYKLLSSKLSTESSSKRRKVAPEQIALFGNDLTPINELEPKEIEVDFKNLAKDEKTDEKTKESIEEEFEIIDNEVDIKNDEIDIEDTTSEENSFDTEEKETKDVTVDEKIFDKKESETEDLFEEEKKRMSETLESIIPKKSQEEFDKYQTYDIKIVENIMHQSFSIDARNGMKRINGLWGQLEKGIDPIDLGIIELLKDGNVVAVGDKEFIITYKTAALCNQVMRQSFKNKSLTLLEKILGDKYNYIALPEKIWLEKRQEYVNQYTIGIKYPKLTPINDPELIIYTQEYTDPKDQMIKKAKAMFGEDIVNVE
ncbi:MAG TPA: DNA polymerase III subunit gamma/tau [Acholeplasmataceae bacterium]|nr:DNA polymerase III subunit gamma/tau [Acholeplasmataceae bacterium]